MSYQSLAGQLDESARTTGKSPSRPWARRRRMGRRRSNFIARRKTSGRSSSRWARRCPRAHPSTTNRRRAFRSRARPPSAAGISRPSTSSCAGQTATSTTSTRMLPAGGSAGRIGPPSTTSAATPPPIRPQSHGRRTTQLSSSGGATTTSVSRQSRAAPGPASPRSERRSAAPTPRRRSRRGDRGASTSSSAGPTTASITSPAQRRTTTAPRRRETGRPGNGSGAPAPSWASPPRCRGQQTSSTFSSTATITNSGASRLRFERMGLVHQYRRDALWHDGGQRVFTGGLLLGPGPPGCVLPRHGQPPLAERLDRQLLDGPHPARRNPVGQPVRARDPRRAAYRDRCADCRPWRDGHLAEILARDGAGTARVVQSFPCSGTSPGANEVFVYDGVNFAGQCAALRVGLYPNAGNMGLPNDAISSLKVGGGARVRLFADGVYNGSQLTKGPGNYSTIDTGWDNVVSSLRVEESWRSLSCNDLLDGEFAVFADANFAGDCVVLRYGQDTRRSSRSASRTRRSRRSTRATDGLATRRARDRAAWSPRSTSSRRSTWAAAPSRSHPRRPRAT